MRGRIEYFNNPESWGVRKDEVEATGDSLPGVAIIDPYGKHAESILVAC
jgi:hypothetical protein